jgi:hypothetical protein
MVNKSGDPIAFWQQMVGEMQRGFSAFTRLRPSASSPLQSSNDPATPAGNGQKPMADLMENYFAGMNMPSRAQLNALNERLVSIEAQLGETRALLNELLTASKAPRPPSDSTAHIAPQLSEIKALLGQMLDHAKASGPMPAIDAELRDIKAALDTLLKPPQAVEAQPKAAEVKAVEAKAVEPAPRSAKSRNKKPAAQGGSGRDDTETPEA